MAIAVAVWSGCANPSAPNARGVSPTTQAAAPAPTYLADSPIAITGLTENGQYTGIKITRVTDTELYFTTADGTFGVRPIADIPQIAIRDNAGFNKAEDLLAADKFVEAVAQYNASLARQSEGDIKTLFEARLALSEQFVKDGRPNPASRPAVHPTPEPGKTLTLDLGKVTMKLALIPASKFMMGSPASEKDRSADEGPQREVTITKPFYMGVYELTQEQWTAVMGTAPWKDQEYAKDGANNAANYISWNDATGFCNKLSTKTGKMVSLPTEAQWEYACRAGSKTRFSYGDDDDCSKLGNYAWYSENTCDSGEPYAHAVGQKKANDFGLYDMHGNVWEWCADRYADPYADAKNTDPQGPASGTTRVLRGGGWGFVPWFCRSAYRAWHVPVYRDIYVGFRVVMDLK